MWNVCAKRWTWLALFGALMFCGGCGGSDGEKSASQGDFAKAQDTVKFGNERQGERSADRQDDRPAETDHTGDPLSGSSAHEDDQANASQITRLEQPRQQDLVAPGELQTPVEKIIGALPELKPPIKNRRALPRIASPAITAPKTAESTVPFAPRNSQFSLPPAKPSPLRSTPTEAASPDGFQIRSAGSTNPGPANPGPAKPPAAGTATSEPHAFDKTAADRNEDAANAFAMESAASESLPPPAMPPDLIAPESIAPDWGAPELVAPESMAAESMAAESMPPDATAAERSATVAVQTKMTVFYATDRVSKTSLEPGEWTEVFFTALVAAGVAGLFFVLAFLFKRKALPVLLGAVVLAVGLLSAYNANIAWQKRVRLAEHGDAFYTSEMKQGTAAAELDYGTCQVNIPPDRRIGTVPSPSIIRLEFSEDTGKHVILERVIPVAKQKFYTDLNQCLEKDASRQAFVFIHGYNVGFEDAVKRTAQIAFDLKFAGAPICYSWSSHGSLENYTRDFANASSTVTRLESFLLELVDQSRAQTVHLVAHSMGNHALLQALEKIASRHRGPGKLFGQLVMAAPDVSSIDFRNRYAESIQRLVRQATLYASSTDRALMASTSVWGHNRAGLSGDNLVVVDGVDTIDVSGVDTSLIGHSYYGDRPELIRDLRAIVELVGPASSRDWLERVFVADGQTYYKFR